LTSDAEPVLGSLFLQKTALQTFSASDGDFVPKDALEIPADRYVSFDLTRTYNSMRRFDLVVSLEVAEHLPTQWAGFFRSSGSCDLARRCCFPRTIPGQGGTHHVNEQWQDYWANLFLRHDYVPIDDLGKRGGRLVVRPKYTSLLLLEL